MFGKKRYEELKLLLESAQKDRELYAEQAAQDRALFVERLAALGIPQGQPARLDTLIESAAQDRAMYIQQAEEDRNMVATQLALIASSAKAPHTAPHSTPAIEKGNELKAAYALNLCTVSISQIIDYNDLIVMEQEYEAILNNLNLENFPKDEALLKILKQILDVVSFFRIQAEEKKIQEEEYKKKVKDAVWSAVPSPSMILAGGSAGWVGLAVGAVMAVGTGYMNYRRERANIDVEQRRKNWELQRSAMEQFDGLRRELFDTAWRLADTYKFDDSYRLTARQISQYNNILADVDPLRRYERLSYLRDNFVAYPPFWYYLGHAAAEVSTLKTPYGNLAYPELSAQYREKALEAYQVFLNSVDDDVHKNLLREDQTCAACALETFALVAKDATFPHEEKVKLLKKAAKNAGNAFDTLQICATSYLAIGEVDSAISLMRMLVNEGYNVELNAQMLGMLYVSAYIGGNTAMRDEYTTLLSRVDGSFPLPPLPTSTQATTTALASQYMSDQCTCLLNCYKDTVCEYIIQCERSFEKLLITHGDISGDVLEFIQNIEQDMKALFDDQVALKVRTAIMDIVTTIFSVEANKELLTTAARRMDNPSFTFEKLFKDAFLVVADAIENYIVRIKHTPTDKQLSRVSEYTGQILLFKKNKQIYGSSTAVSVTETTADPYEILRKSGEKNELVRKCNAVIKRFLEHDSLINASRKNPKAKIFTQHDSADIASYMSSKKNIPGDIDVVAIIDTNYRDLIFTSTGLIVPRMMHDSPEVSYGSVEFLSDCIRVGDIKFSNDDIDLSALARLINELAIQMPCSSSNSCLAAFKEKMAQLAI